MITNNTASNLVGSIVDGYRVVEAFGADSDIESLKNDAVAMARATGSVGITSSMQDTSGNVSARVRVEKADRSDGIDDLVRELKTTRAQRSRSN